MSGKLFQSVSEVFNIESDTLDISALSPQETVFCGNKLRYGNGRNGNGLAINVQGGAITRSYYNISQHEPA